ncbi:MAG TPA: S8 family serine peptidase [Chitinophagaceae bacterium]|nr:S8 family serine peptidase [Chitinophagaceae bacterium]
MEELKTFSNFKEQLYKIEQASLIKIAGQKGWPLQKKKPDGSIIYLSGIGERGLPVYIGTTSNLNAAATIGTNQLWAGGNLGLNLDGGSANMGSKLALWDEGRVRESHQEIGTNRIINADAGGAISSHSTHIAGTLIAKGINPIAKGMSFNATNLIVYDWNSDISEMAAASGTGLLISNHSYGATSAGWSQNSSQNNRWEFGGEWGANEDFQFGYYDNRSRDWDNIVSLAPYYLIVKSAGNKRSENGPAVGANYWRYNENGVMIDAGPRPAGISSNDSYDILPRYATAKNILTVGAVNAIPEGYKNSSQVVMSSFSSWGPTDDGRIKPDVVANGVGLTSTSNTGDNAYFTASGTSMSSPNASGSLILLQEHYNLQTGGSFMRSASLKGLVIHTADEAGPSPGPDYMFGWGLLNIKKAATVISNRNTISRILEDSLIQNIVKTIDIVASGTGPLTATLSWTDPAGTVELVNVLNNRTPKLVHDLDIEINHGTTVFKPWKLDPLNPSFPATQGDNIVDNIEKIDILNPIPGEPYSIKIKNKGTLRNNKQAFSLIISGVGGQVYCTSGPSINTNSRIDNFKFGGIDNTPATGCTQYSSYVNQFATVYPNQVLPLNVTLGTCGSNIDKIVKVFIDWNTDGDFQDADELVATSGIINGTGNFSTDITVPASVQTGFNSRIRVVAMETTNASDILPCGTYTSGGETQDYSIGFTKVPNDIMPEAIVFPDNNTCASDSIYVLLKLKNVGNNPVANFPVTVIIKNVAATVATLKDSVKQVVTSDGNLIISLRSTFNALPGINYQFTFITELSSDQNKINDTLVSTITFLAPSGETISNLVAQQCSDAQTGLSGTTNGGTIFWYDNPTSKTPLGSGASFTTGIIPSNKTYYAGVNDAAGRIGAVSKSEFTSGGYRTLASYMTIETFSPVLIETARMYFGNSGRITVNLFNEITGVLTASTTLDVPATHPNPQAGDLTENNPLDTGRIVPLNLRIPAAGKYSMNLNYENGVTVFRNNSGTVPYPYTIPGLMRLTGNNGNPQSSFYYYFYDMKVKSLGCAKPFPRQSVVAANPLSVTISQNGAVLSSSISSGTFQWYLDNTAISGATNSTYTLTQSGTYKVEVTIGNCTFGSPYFTTSVTSIPPINPAEINLTVTNNPGNGIYNIVFSVKKKEKIQMEILNIAGQVIQRDEFEIASAGLVQREINISRNASGIYLMKLYFDKKQYVHKLILR